MWNIVPKPKLYCKWNILKACNSRRITGRNANSLFLPDNQEFLLLLLLLPHNSKKQKQKNPPKPWEILEKKKLVPITYSQKENTLQAVRRSTVRKIEA